MTTQKSRAKYIGAPVGLRLSEAPLPNNSQQNSLDFAKNTDSSADTHNLEACMWKLSGDCEKSMPELYKRCKGTCFAYIPAEKKQEGDYQI